MLDAPRRVQYDTATGPELRPIYGDPYSAIMRVLECSPGSYARCCPVCSLVLKNLPCKLTLCHHDIVPLTVISCS